MPNFIYLCTMQGLNKFLYHILNLGKLIPKVAACYSSTYSAFDKQFNYFPTYKDFNN